jgi:hypothetical protein
MGLSEKARGCAKGRKLVSLIGPHGSRQDEDIYRTFKIDVSLGITKVKRLEYLGSSPSERKSQKSQSLVIPRCYEGRFVMNEWF